MAIKIPSKNIYEINNPKIRDNLIDNVSVEQFLAKEVKEYQEQVYSTKIELLTQSAGSEIIDQQGSRGTYSFANLHYSICSYISIVPKYIENYTIKFDKLLINKVINKVYLGKDKNEDNEIKSTIKYSLKEYNAKGSAEVKIGDSGAEATFTDISHDPTTIKKTSSSVSLFSPQLSYTFENTNSYGTQSITADISNKFTNLTNLLGDKDYVDTDDYISFNIDILSAYNTTKLGGYADDIGVAPKTVDVSGVYQEYTADEIEISIYGDTIYLDLTDGSITYIKDKNGEIVEGKGSKPHSLSGNELLQDSGKTNGIAISEHLANNVLTQYSKGKETATILCDIADYYNENGKEVISTKAPLLPNKYQEVEYIESYDSYDNIYGNGVVKGAYIDTEYVPNKNTGFDIVFQSNNTLSSNHPTSPSDNGFGAILGARKGSWDNDFQLNTYNSYSTTIGGTFRDGVSPYINANIEVGVKQHCTLRGTTYTNNNGFTTSGVMVDEFDTEGSLYLFALNSKEENNAVQRGRMKLYSCIITESGKIVRNFIPCYRISDNEIGLYDTVQGKFYSNSGDIGFKKGKNIKSMVFNNHDEVIPYVFGANGQDQPMSRYQDGTAKVFEVVGSNIIYDGAIWQELTLLEKNK